MNKRWPGLKKICCYIWDPVYVDLQEDPDDQKTDDGWSVGNPEVTISKEPIGEVIQSSDSAESSTETESGSEDEMETKTFSNIVRNLLSAEQKNVLRHRAGTVKRITQEKDTDRTVISPFAVCGGYRVGSLRQLFNPTKLAANQSKKRAVRFTDGTQKADPALKVR